MKKIIILLCSLLLIVGCQREQVEQEEPIDQEEPTFYERNMNPPPAVLTTGDRGVMLPLVSYCWNPDLRQCPATLSAPPEQAVFDGVSAIRIKPNEEGHINATGLEEAITGNSNNTEEKLLFPSKVEVFKVVDGQLESVELKDNSFMFPNQKGRYTYVIKVTYDNEWKGIAFHAFQGMVIE
ncbi:hypothetical protein P9B03_07555 [Metasolibacillus meyeri]|uniref:Lipoprotein n=1 Tax=Metasolibacillus meyeri TaxID=1071052 RepID=A0AAW9NR06_9BACL|nr:hypothetical protein [Metasolibacillus meyeri]MEC1178333.1 hypothetical protein [Metasolibacillus meyeri]